MATKVPAFTYSGTCSSEIKNGYWYIYLKSSGTLKLTYAKNGVGLCVVGGGAGGEAHGISDRGGHGGGGGTVANRNGIEITGGTEYAIVVGDGGAAGTNGTASSAFGYTAAGGSCGGGNCGLSIEDNAGTAGGNGTYAFWDTSLLRYGAGGGGGGSNDINTPGDGGEDGGGRGGYGADQVPTAAVAATAGTANTGSGGGGAGQSNDWSDDDGYNNNSGGAAAAGGSGVVIIRGTEDDFLPVYFDGKQLSEIYFNGEKISGLIYGGTRLFAEAMRLLSRREKQPATTVMV